MEDLFRTAPMARIAMGRSLELVYLPLQESACLLDQRDVRAALLCSPFRSFSGHQARLQEALPPADGPCVDIAALARQGLLLSRADLFDRINAFPPVDSPSLAWFAIPTANRPAELVRALRSYVLNFVRSRRSLRILVADDSPIDDPTYAGRLNELRVQVADTDLDCWYLGRTAKRQLVDLLAEGTGIPRGIAEFAICPADDMAPTMGANRNAIQLCCAGDMLLTADDDTVCRPCFAPGDADLSRVRLGSESDPTEFWFFPSVDEALATARFADVDIVSGHQRILGRPVWAVVRDCASDSDRDIETLCNHLLVSLWRGRGSVVVTMNGCAGDSGMHSGRGLRYHEAPGTRERLVASEQDYRMALSSRHVIRQAPATTICHGTRFSTMFIGLDNRELLPPFLPVCRNEDGVFAVALRQCVPDSFFGYLPWSLVHAPTGSREYDLRFVTRMSEIVIACMLTWIPTGTSSREQRIQSLGRFLAEIARLPPAEFREWLRFALWHLASRKIARAEALLKGSVPSYWAADVENEIDAIAESLTKADFGLPADLAPGGSQDELLDRSQNVVGRYGDLLYWWPAMIARSKELRSRDELPIHRIT
jgi:hypothetical protein